MSSDPPTAADGTTLQRSVTGPLLLLLVVGDILGAGIYILVGEVSAEVGGAAWLAFLGAFTIAGLAATSYSELVTRFPGSAGSALYAEKAFKREGITFAVGMAVMLSSLSTAATTTRAFAGEYLSVFIDAPIVPVAVALLAVLTALSIRGIRFSARVNVAMTLIEVGGLIVVLVVGGAAIADGVGDPGQILDLGGLSTKGMLTATALAFFAFLGFEDAVHLSEEVVDPRRTFPRVLFASVAIASVLYLAVVAVATMAVDPETLAASNGPLLEVVRLGPLAVSERWFALVALVAVTNTSLFALVASSRLLFGMATSGSVPRVFGRVHPRWQTPVTASVAMAVLAVLLATSGAVEELAGAAVTLLLAVLVMVNLAAWLTRPEADDDTAFRAQSWVAPTGAISSGTLLVHQLITASAGDIARLGFLGAVVLVLWFASRYQRNRYESPRADSLT